MMATEFWETGASGRRYSREFVLKVLEERASPLPDADWQSSDFYCQQLAQNSFLLTYTLLQGARKTRRSSLWRRATKGWRIVYHHGAVMHE